MLRKPVVGALLAVLLTSGPSSAGSVTVGKTSAPDGVLRSGCHHYRYHYVVKYPTDDWVLETFLVDRRGEVIASGVFGPPSETKRERERFRLCRWNTVPGKFTIRAKLTDYSAVDQDGSPTVRWFRPSGFRLTLRR